MYDVGRVCVKLAGRDAGNYCAVVEVLENGFVLIDGNTRRRKVNTSHLEPTGKTIEIKKGADNKTVVEALKKSGIEASERVESKKKPTQRQKKQKAKKEKPEVKADTKKTPKSSAKADDKPEERPAAEEKEKLVKSEKKTKPAKKISD